MNDEPIHCPNCGSQQLTANKKGLSITKAALGGFLLGPVGLAAGAIGKDKIRITCLKCGRVWEPGDLMRPVPMPRKDVPVEDAGPIFLAVLAMFAIIGAVAYFTMR